LDKILTAQSSVGTRLNVLDNQEGLNTDFVLNMKTYCQQQKTLNMRKHQQSLICKRIITGSTAALPGKKIIIV